MPLDEYAAITPSSVLPFRLRPSRSFAIRQAIIIALAEAYPYSTARGGQTATICRYLIEAHDFIGYLPDDFLWLVRRNYREIAARYDLKEMESCR